MISNNHQPVCLLINQNSQHVSKKANHDVVAVDTGNFMVAKHYGSR